VEASLALAGQAQLSSNIQGKRGNLDILGWLEYRGCLPWEAGTKRVTGRSPCSNFHPSTTSNETELSYQLENSTSQAGSHTTRWLDLALLSGQEQAGLCSCVTGGAAWGWRIQGACNYRILKKV
jgi:hypothetical protein